MMSNISANGPEVSSSFVQEVQAIGAVGQILETVATITGLGFVAIAHVTEQSWTTCAVLDKLDFGLKVGDGLDVTTTLCDEVRATTSSIVIDNVLESDKYRDHHTPRIYGFQSYFSIPIFRFDGAYFGTLCGLDPKPASLSAPATLSTLQLFAQLISKQLEAERVHANAQYELSNERETAELREQFVAVLGHDLRTPLGALQSGVELLRIKHPDPGSLPVLQRMRRSIGRMTSLVNDVDDFTRGRMGGGISLDMRHENDLAGPLGQVVEELRALHPERTIVAEIQPNLNLLCDVGRLGQLLSNLLKNAIVHGNADVPVTLNVHSKDGSFIIEVSNGGAAFSNDVVKRLFKPFSRASSNGTHQGLGLGLYIVSEIARSHGGDINVSFYKEEVSFRFSMRDHSRVDRRLVAR